MKKKLFIYAAVFMMCLVAMPKIHALNLNSATSLSGEATITSEDENVNVSVKYSAKELNIEEEDESASKDGRPGGSAWLGIKITKPADASEDAVYWNLDSNGKISKIKKFSDYADKGNANELSAWSGVSFNAIYSAKISGSDVISKKWVFDWDNDGTEDQTFTVEIEIEDITLKKDGKNIYPLADLASVRLLNPTSATISDDKSNFVTIKYNDAFTLDWAQADETLERPVDGWWVGIEVTAPTGYDALATFKTRRNNGEYSEPYKFNDEKDEGKDNVLSAWVLINEKYLRENENITFDLAFDWNNDGEYEQTITQIIPTANVTIEKDGEVVDPNVVEEPDNEPEVPNTFDGIALYLGFGIVALIGLVSCIVLFKKKAINR